MIFIIGDIVRLSDGTYDEVIGFNGDIPITRRKYRTWPIRTIFDYRSMNIIGHAWPIYDRTNGVAVTLYVQ